MTALAPPTVRVEKATTSTGGRSGPVAWMALPALAIFVAFGVVPLLGVLWLSFTTWDGIGTVQPSGLTTWKYVLSDPGLPHSLYVTFLIMILSWAVQTPLSILIGAFLAGQEKYRALLAVLYFVPLLLSSAAIAITYKALLDPNFGLGSGLGVDVLVQDWLGNGKLAVGVVIFVVSWQFIPFHSLIYQGGIRQIPISMGPAGYGASSASPCRRSSTRSSRRRR
jgi:raffinose/stachyose/melibiose transport system permease protein